MSVGQPAPMLHKLAERSCFEATVKGISATTELLATNSHGVVWRATWQHADVAVKASVSNPTGGMPFARLLPHAQHVHVVHVYHREAAHVHGSGEECLVEMRELCMGGALFELVGAGICASPASHVSPKNVHLAPRVPLEPELVQLMRWFRQIVLAVAHCHAHGFVCGQLRREHVQLSGSGDIKLLGFRHASTKHPIALKPWHPTDAPELKGRSTASHTDCFPADVYAIGSLVGLLGGLHVATLRNMGAKESQDTSFSLRAGKTTPPSSLQASQLASMDALDQSGVDSDTEVAAGLPTPGSPASNPGSPGSASGSGSRASRLPAFNFFPTPVRKLLSDMTVTATASRPTAKAAASRLCPLGDIEHHQLAFEKLPTPPKADTALQIRCPGWSNLCISADEIEMLLRTSLRAVPGMCVQCYEHVALGTKGSRALVVYVHTSSSKLTHKDESATAASSRARATPGSSSSTTSLFSEARLLGYSITKVYGEESADADSALLGLRNGNSEAGASGPGPSSLEPSKAPRFLALILISTEDGTNPPTPMPRQAPHPRSVTDSPHAGYASPSPAGPPHRIDVRRLQGSHEAFHAFFRRLCSRMALHSDGRSSWKTTSPVSTQWWVASATSRGSSIQRGNLPRASSYEASLSSLAVLPPQLEPGHPPTPLFSSRTDVSDPQAPSAVAPFMSMSRRQHKGTLATITASGSWSRSLDALEASEAVSEYDISDHAHEARQNSSSSGVKPGASILGGAESQPSTLKDAQLPLARTKKAQSSNTLLQLDRLSIGSRAVQATAAKRLSGEGSSTTTTTCDTDDV